MKRIVAGPNDAGQRLDKFLAKLLKTASMGMIYKWLRKKRVKVNGKKQDISYMLCKGDILELYINDEFFDDAKPVANHLKKDFQLKTVYEDENILIADKPSGISCHGEDGCLLDRIQAYLFKKGEYDPKKEQTFAPALCNLMCSPCHKLCLNQTTVIKSSVQCLTILGTGNLIVIKINLSFLFIF